MSSHSCMLVNLPNMCWQISYVSMFKLIVYLQLCLLSLPKGSKMQANDFSPLFLSMGSGYRGYPEHINVADWIHSTRINKVSPANSWAQTNQANHTICGTRRVCMCVLFLCFCCLFPGRVQGFRPGSQRWVQPLVPRGWSAAVFRFSGHQPVLFVVSICPWSNGDPGAKHRGLRDSSLFATGPKGSEGIRRDPTGLEKEGSWWPDDLTCWHSPWMGCFGFEIQ